MKAAHTPGPWTAFPHSHNAGASYVQAAPRGLAPGRVVVGGVAHADATLIAAAPDLLAALKNLARAWDFAMLPGGPLDPGSENSDLANAAAAAIARAEGGTE